MLGHLSYDGSHTLMLGYLFMLGVSGNWSVNSHVGSSVIEYLMLGVLPLLGHLSYDGSHTLMSCYLFMLGVSGNYL